MKNILYQDATIKDLDLVTKFEADLVISEREEHKADIIPDWQWSIIGQNEYKRLLKSKNDKVIIAYDQKERRLLLPIAYIIGSFEKEDSCQFKTIVSIEGLYVKKEFRGQRIGTNLIELMMMWAEAKHADGFRIEAYAGNKEANALYKKMFHKDSISYTKRLKPIKTMKYLKAKIK